MTWLRLVLPRLPRLVLVLPLLTATCVTGWFTAGLDEEATWLAVVRELQEEHAGFDCTRDIARTTRDLHDGASPSIESRLREPGTSPALFYDPLTSCMEELGY